MSQRSNSIGCDAHLRAQIQGLVEAPLSRMIYNGLRALEKTTFKLIDYAEQAGTFGVANMATGWAGDGAVQDQIDATVKDAVSRVKSQLPQGPSLAQCAECGGEIPEARRKAIPGVRLCLSCQSDHDRDMAKFSGYNRRGSKDSQLR